MGHNVLHRPRGNMLLDCRPVFTELANAFKEQVVLLFSPFARLDISCRLLGGIVPLVFIAPLAYCIFDFEPLSPLLLLAELSLELIDHEQRVLDEWLGLKLVRPYRNYVFVCNCAI